MSIRFQLLVIALSTLVLPWAGCQYAHELESTLRISQENSLQAAADTIANALSADARAFGDLDGDGPFDPSRGDLYAFPLHNQPLLDGYRDDWGVDAQPTPLPANGLAARLQAGFTERFLFLYLEVDEPRFTPEPNNAHPERDRFDRVDVTMQRDGSMESVFFATGAPGLIEAQSIVKGDDGMDHAAPEARIQAFWLQTSRGLHLEAKGLNYSGEVMSKLLERGVRLSEVEVTHSKRTHGVSSAKALKGARDRFLFVMYIGLRQLLLRTHVLQRPQAFRETS